jgi:hypothetical protein
MKRTRNRVAKTAWAPIMVLLCIFMYSITSPQNYTETGFLFFYPLYSDWYIQSLYTTGTWVWICMITWLMQAYCNKMFNQPTYKLLTGSSLYAYVSHYFFIIMIAIFVIRPYKITFIPALVLEIVLTNAIILVTYIILDFVYELFVPPKQKQQDKDEEERQQLLQQQEVLVKNK